MRSPLAICVERFDSVYRGRPYFVRMKARLLAAFDVLILLFIPLNVGKLLWFQPPELLVRFGINASFASAALVSLHLACRGRLEAAGNALVLIAIAPIQAAALLAPSLPEPLGAAIQMFIFDIVLLLLAIVFTSRRMALATLTVIVASHLALHAIRLREVPLAGSMNFAAETMLRDGLIAFGFVFCLGIVIVTLIEGAHRRSDEALRETRGVNENLGRLVTERTRDLEAATHRANDASRAKGDFLANMSHEIRTPLNGIIASADLLRLQPDLPPAAAEQARLVAESGDLLLRLLGDILDFSKIEAGQLALESAPFSIGPLVTDTLALIMTRATAEDVRVDWTMASGLSGQFVGDNFRLRQILLNLLSNAVKFTPAGGHVQLTIDSPAADAVPTPVRFEVRDTGIGMEGPMMDRLFERFTQADSSTTRQYGGTGLGLSISLHLVEMMGGKLAAESVPGQGSIFHFTIPLAPAGLRGEPSPAPEAAPPPRRLGLNVLVAEDNAINRRILAAQLERLGCQCTLASDGEELIAALQRAPSPDVVLMDCHMPRLDGWGATERVRAWATAPEASPIQRAAATLPIVALTAAALPEERARCLAVGMSDFLAKPVKLADLQRVLEPLSREDAPTVPRPPPPTKLEIETRPG